MREIRTSGSMSGDGKRGGFVAATAPILDSTDERGRAGLKPRPSGHPLKTTERGEESRLEGVFSAPLMFQREKLWHLSGHGGLSSSFPLP